MNKLQLRVFGVGWKDMKRYFPFTWREQIEKRGLIEDLKQELKLAAVEYSNSFKEFDYRTAKNLCQRRLYYFLTRNLGIKRKKNSGFQVVEELVLDKM